MLYAVVKDGLVTEQISRPKWFTDDGPVTDEDLIAAGVYPVEDVIPNYNPVTHHVIRKPFSDWVIREECVEITYDILPNSTDQIEAIFQREIQRKIDDTARARRYDSGMSLSTYVNSTNTAWAAEAQAFIAWRDAVWVYAYTELEKALNQQRDIPTIEEFLNELPEISWPV